jgi:hypothetical protein
MELMLDSDRKLRYEYYELFDAGNIDDNGNILEPDSPRAQYNKVSESNLMHLEDHKFICDRGMAFSMLTLHSILGVHPTLFSEQLFCHLQKLVGTLILRIQDLHSTICQRISKRR